MLHHVIKMGIAGRNRITRGYEKIPKVRLLYYYSAVIELVLALPEVIIRQWKLIMKLFCRRRIYCTLGHWNPIKMAIKRGLFTLILNQEI
jgi:hypothetical protein